MPVNIRSADHLNLPTEETAAKISQSSEPPSASTEERQARINQEINHAAQNFDQIAGAGSFTTETNGSTTKLNFGDGVNGAKLPTDATGLAGYSTGLGEAGNNPAAGGTQESQILGLLESELGGDGAQAQELANAIGRGGQAGMELALGIADALSNLPNGADQSNQTETQGSTGDPVPTAGNDFSALIDDEKIRHIKA